MKHSKFYFTTILITLMVMGILFLSSCGTEKQKSGIEKENVEYTNTKVYNLPVNTKLVNVWSTSVYDNVLTRPMRADEVAETYTFWSIEKANPTIYTIVEHKNENIKKTN